MVRESGCHFVRAPSKRASESVEQKKVNIRRAANYYGVLRNCNKKKKSLEVECCPTGTIGNGSRVKLAHLIPASCSLVQYNKFGVENHEDFRNIVSLASNIKMAFDKQRITFDIGDKSYKLIILDPIVVNEPIYPSDEKTIGEFKGKEMKFSERTSLPNRRLSLYHAK